MYFVITCSNGFASCDEKFYVRCEENEVDAIAEELLFNNYSYGEDEFYDEFDEDEDAFYNEYSELTYCYEEITKEEYKANADRQV